jgi:hypothetical protein
MHMPILYIILTAAVGTLVGAVLSLIGCLFSFQLTLHWKKRSLRESHEHGVIDAIYETVVSRGITVDSLQIILGHKLKQKTITLTKQ